MSVQFECSKCGKAVTHDASLMAFVDADGLPCISGIPGQQPEDHRVDGVSSETGQPIDESDAYEALRND